MDCCSQNATTMLNCGGEKKRLEILQMGEAFASRSLMRPTRAWMSMHSASFLERVLIGSMAIPAATHLRTTPILRFTSSPAMFMFLSTAGCPAQGV